MFPEAGGSSSFARHAFNELVSFFAGWALSLDYILTIAISAFFVPHYLGAFWPALTHPPGDVIGGLIVVALLAWLNIRGIGESAKLNFVLAVSDLLTQVLIILIGAVFVLNPSLLVNQVHLGTVPTYSHLIFALSLAMLAYTGIETVSNMAEEARDPGRDVPKAVNLILFAVLGVYAGMTVVALSALPVLGHGKNAYTLLGLPPPHGFQNDPVLGHHRAPRDQRHANPRAPLLRRDPGGDDPVHRHQRRADRDLAAVLVAGRAPSAPGDLRPAAPPPPDAVVHDPGVLRDRGDPAHPRADGLSGQSVLVRGNAVVHHRARGGDRDALQGARARAALPDALERAGAGPGLAADGSARRDRDVRSLDIGDGAPRRRPLRGNRLDGGGDESDT